MQLPAQHQASSFYIQAHLGHVFDAWLQKIRWKPIMICATLFSMVNNHNTSTAHVK